MAMVGIFAPPTDAGAEQVRKEAVAAGVAEWVPDAGGRPVFQWKVPPGGPK
jgi:hypothetical protein